MLFELVAAQRIKRGPEQLGADTGPLWYAKGGAPLAVCQGTNLRTKNLFIRK